LGKSWNLEAEVGEGLVGFSHSVRVVFLFHRAAFALRCGLQLIGKAHRETLVVTRAGVLNDPSKRQGHSPLGPHFYRHLVGGATYTSATNLDERGHVVYGFLENLEAGLVGAILDDIKSAVDEILSRAFLAAFHDAVDETPDKLVPVNGINGGSSNLSSVSSHCGLVFSFGLAAAQSASHEPETPVIG